MSDAAVTREAVRVWLTERIAGYIKTDSSTIDPSVPLATYGLDSVSAVVLVVDVEDQYGIALEPDALWEHRSIDPLADLIVGRLRGVSPEHG